MSSFLRFSVDSEPDLIAFAVVNPALVKPKTPRRSFSIWQQLQHPIPRTVDQEPSNFPTSHSRSSVPIPSLKPSAMRKQSETTTRRVSESLSESSSLGPARFAVHGLTGICWKNQESLSPMATSGTTMSFISSCRARTARHASIFSLTTVTLNILPTLAMEMILSWECPTRRNGTR